MKYGAHMYAKAKRLWQLGIPVKDISNQCGVPYCTIMRWAEHHREDFPARRKSARITRRQRQKVIKLRAKGLTYKRIAEAVGIHENSVLKIVKEEERYEQEKEQEEASEEDRAANRSKWHADQYW